MKAKSYFMTIKYCGWLAEVVAVVADTWEWSSWFRCKEWAVKHTVCSMFKDGVDYCPGVKLILLSEKTPVDKKVQRCDITKVEDVYLQCSVEDTQEHHLHTVRVVLDVTFQPGNPRHSHELMLEVLALKDKLKYAEVSDN